MNDKNRDMIDSWNGATGEKWVRNADRLDSMMAGFLPDIVESAGISAGQRVLDLGCGGGSLSFAAEAATDADGRVTGIDVSGPLLTLARQRADARGSKAVFEQVDGEDYRAAEPFDAAVSRFGVMFFTNPVVAYSHFRQNLKKDGVLSFVCWQGLMQNDWALVPQMVIRPFLPEPPAPPAPRTPGPFAFAEADWITEIFEKAGWQTPEITTLTKSLPLPGATLDEMTDYVLQLGPGSQLVADQEVDPGPVREAMMQELSNRQDADGKVRLDGRAHLVRVIV